MLDHEGTGGETVLVDGYRAAESLKIKHLESFDTLCNTAIKAEYIETDTVHFSATDPVIKLHPVTREVFHIRLVPTSLV